MIGRLLRRVARELRWVAGPFGRLGPREPGLRPMTSVERAEWRGMIEEAVRVA